MIIQRIFKITAEIRLDFAANLVSANIKLFSKNQEKSSASTLTMTARDVFFISFLDMARLVVGFFVRGGRECVPQEPGPNNKFWSDTPY